MVTFEARHGLVDVFPIIGGIPGTGRRLGGSSAIASSSSHSASCRLTRRRRASVFRRAMGVMRAGTAPFYRLRQPSSAERRGRRGPPTARCGLTDYLKSVGGRDSASSASRRTSSRNDGSLRALKRPIPMRATSGASMRSVLRRPSWTRSASPCPIQATTT